MKWEEDDEEVDDDKKSRKKTSLVMDVVVCWFPCNNSEILKIWLQKQKLLMVVKVS